MPANLSLMIRPQSIAVVGASREENKIGNIVVRNLVHGGYKGRIYPVNPKANEILGLVCYPDYKSIPEVADLAVISLPATLVNEVLKQVADRGTKNVVIFSAGYKEAGDEGKKLEAEMVELARERGLNILGPNCLGLVNNEISMNVTFGQGVREHGNLRFISQSGAIASSIFDWADYNKLGFKQFITLGNKAVVSELEVLQFWEEELRNKDNRNQPGESSYQPVGMYLESITRGEEFVAVVKRITHDNPVFMLKPGKTQAAAKAMQSHTGAIAGEDVVLTAALSQAGVIRCEGIEDMFDLARAFAWEEAPKGNRVAIVSNAGGPAVISADVVVEANLQLAQLSDAAKSKLMEALPRAASLMNPVDVLGDAMADRYKAALETVAAEESVDAMIVLLTPQVMTQIAETAEVIGQVSKRFNKPIVCSFMGGSLITPGEKVLNGYKIPSFRFPERAIKALGKMWWWQNWRQLEAGKVAASVSPRNGDVVGILERGTHENRGVTGVEANQILKQTGMIVAETRQIDDDNLAGITAELGYPVVMKLVGPNLIHKTEVGGVIVGIKNEEELRNKYEEIKQRVNSLSEEQKQGVVVTVQKQVDKGIEVIVGMKKDPSFSWVLMFGAGGTLAELISDRNLRLLPLNQEEIKELIVQSKVGKLLTGFRGDQGYAISSLVELVEKLQGLTSSLDGISEIEINPVIVTRDKAYAIDGRIIRN
jgi:acetyltransferase